jgi:hypothetical protein
MRMLSNGNAVRAGYTETPGRDRGSMTRCISGKHREPDRANREGFSLRRSSLLPGKPVPARCAMARDTSGKFVPTSRSVASKTGAFVGSGVSLRSRHAVAGATPTSGITTATPFLLSLSRQVRSCDKSNCGIRNGGVSDILSVSSTPSMCIPSFGQPSELDEMLFPVTAALKRNVSVRSRPSPFA